MFFALFLVYPLFCVGNKNEYKYKACNAQKAYTLYIIRFNDKCCIFMVKSINNSSLIGYDLYLKKIHQNLYRIRLQVR